MGVITFPPMIKPICAILHSESAPLDLIMAQLESLLGSSDLTSESYAFDFTDYYDSRMITPLRKFFMSFSSLMKREELPAIKQETNIIEDRFAIEGKIKRLRLVNLDPGYIARSKLVLASTKNFSHRIYINDGIYAEVTLTYVKGRFQPHPWTFADYRTKPVISFFRRVREIYMEQLKRQERQ